MHATPWSQQGRKRPGFGLRVTKADPESIKIDEGCVREWYQKGVGRRIDASGGYPEGLERALRKAARVH